MRTMDIAENNITDGQTDGRMQARTDDMIIYASGTACWTKAQKQWFEATLTSVGQW